MYETEEFIMKFSADGTIHAVQPMALAPRGRQKSIHHIDTGDDPSICLTCPLEECSGAAKCYKRRKKAMEEQRK